MSALSAVLSGSLSVTPPTTSTVESGSVSSRGPKIGLNLRAANANPKNEQSNQCVTTVAGFQDLPFPSNLLGRVLCIKMTSSSTSPIAVRTTQEITGVNTITNVHGILLLEFGAADRLTKVEVSGVATFQWVVFGDNA